MCCHYIGCIWSHVTLSLWRWELTSFPLHIHCYMTEENPVSWLVQFTWTNLCLPLNWIKLVYRFILVIFDTFWNQTSTQLKIGMSDISMKFTWFAASSRRGKLKALLTIFNNSFAHFSAFKWEIVNYFVFFTVFFLGTYLFEVERAKYYDINFCTLWNQLLKCMTMALSK